MEYTTRRRSKAKKLEFIEKKLLKDGVYRFLGLDKLSNEINLEQFLKEYFKNMNNSFPTVDSKNNRICDAQKLRSLGDIYRICKYYYPNVTLEQVGSILNKRRVNPHYTKEKIPFSPSWICGTIKRRVYFVSTGYRGYDNYKDEFGRTQKDYLK